MLLKGKHIFVIEDNVSNRAVILTLLQQHGAITHFDQWGTHTIDQLRQLDHVDLILMDLMLPRGVSGYDVFDRLQQVPELATIPVVIVSASDPGAEMTKARERGFMGFITKPINHHTFPHRIASVIQGQQVWADDIVV